MLIQVSDIPTIVVEKNQRILNDGWTKILWHRRPGRPTGLVLHRAWGHALCDFHRYSGEGLGRV